MIQRQVLETQPRIRNPRSAKRATKTRIVQNARAKYTAIVRVGAGLVIALAALMLYVNLTSNVTSLTYSLAKAQRQRDALEEQTARLDERLAQLRSEDHLAAVAAKLGMRDPQSFALVTLAQPTVAQRPLFPEFASLASWFGSPNRRLAGR